MPIFLTIGSVILSNALGIASVNARAMTRPDTNSPRIEVPCGEAPTLDGIIDADEWEDALQLKSEGDAKVFAKHDGTNLYLGFITPPMGVANVYLADESGVHVLHASAALGSVLYRRGESLEEWTRTNAFDWQVRTTDLTPDGDRERMNYLDDHGWTGSNGLTGTPEHWELIISLERLGLAPRSNGAPAPNREDAARVAPAKVAICYFDGQNWKTSLRCPPHLDDDCISPNVQSGNIADTHAFDPGTWVTLAMK